MRALFLGGAKRVSIARMFIDAASRLGHNLDILSYELAPDMPIAEVGEVIVGYKCGDPRVLDDMKRVCAERQVDMVIPFIDPSIELAARLSREMDIFSPTGDVEVMRVMFDKLLAAQAFEAVGIPAPATLSVDAPHWPKIAKPRLGSASKGIVVMEGPDDVGRLTLPLNQYLIQEYIADREEYTVDCYVDKHGSVICAVPRLRIDTAGGEVTRSITVNIPELNRLSIETLNRLRLKGAVTLQFIHDMVTDRWLLMEINPRLGGGCVTAVHAGADLPMFIVMEALGMPVKPIEGWRAGVEIARYMQEVVFFKDETAK